MGPPKSRKSAPRSLKRVRKESKTRLSDSFRTLLRLRAHSFGTLGVLWDSFRTLPGFQARRAREALCGAGPILKRRPIKRSMNIWMPPQMFRTTFLGLVGTALRTNKFAHFSQAHGWEFAKGGAKRIVRFWGGKTYHKAPPPKPVLEASESGICLVCARFL